MLDRKNILKFNLANLLNFLVILFVILGSNTVYVVSMSRNYRIFPLTIGILIIRLLYSFIQSSNFYNIKLFVMNFVWIVYIIVYGLVARGNLSSLFTRFVLLFILLSLFFANEFYRHTIHKIFTYYTKIVLTISALSLVFWILGSLLHLISPNGIEEMYWGRMITTSSYFNVYFQWQDDAWILGHRFFRNIAIFTEGPMFSLHLSFAFLIDYFILKNRSWKKVLFYGLSIFSSVSVTGIITYFTGIVLRKFISSVGMLIKRGKLNGFLLISPIIISVVLILGFNLLLNKLLSASGSSRIEDYIIGFRVWRENPIFGAGYGDTYFRSMFMSMRRLTRAETGFTNSPMAILTEGGLYFFISFLFTYLYPLIRGLKQLDYDLIILSLLLLFVFVTTTFEHTYLMIALMAFVFTSLCYPFSFRKDLIKN